MPLTIIKHRTVARHIHTTLGEKLTPEQTERFNRYQKIVNDESNFATHAPLMGSDERLHEYKGCIVFEGDPTAFQSDAEVDEYFDLMSEEATDFFDNLSMEGPKLDE